MALNQVVMGDEKDLNDKELNELLQKGAISVFLNEKKRDEEIEQFTNASIDDILSSRVESIKRDGGNLDDESNKKGNRQAMFSEATFVADAKDAQINLNDANFWEKLGLGQKKQEEDEIIKNLTRQQKKFIKEKCGYRDDEEITRQDLDLLDPHEIEKTKKTY